MANLIELDLGDGRTVLVASDDDPHADVARLLAELTAALQAARRWQVRPPSLSALASPLPFCCDTLRFTEWLQWVFIPRTRALIDAGAPLPKASTITPMAEEALRGCDWDTTRVIALMRRFDQLIATVR
jgi:uncharacterized protein YqcC (DUF446 family)